MIGHINICLKTFKNYIFVFSSKTMHQVCFNKQGLRVAKQSLCIIQTEAHSCKERHLSSSNRASVRTKQSLCVCLKSLLVFPMQCCLNPGLIYSVILCGNIFKAPSLPSRKSQGAEVLREGSPPPTCPVLNHGDHNTMCYSTVQSSYDHTEVKQMCVVYYYGDQTLVYYSTVQ